MDQAGNLSRQLGVGTAVALIISQVIGIGIFLVPAGMAKSVGSPAWLFGIWAAVGLMTLAGALCYGELAARFPASGGTYVYLREAFGDRIAFLYGWMVLLVLDPGLTALFGVGLAAYVSFIVPMTPVWQQVFAVAAVVAIGVVSILGTRLGGGFVKVLTVLKIGTLAFIILYGFLSGAGDWRNFQPFFAVPADMLGAIAAGVVGAFFAFAGWWEVTRIVGEVRDPERNAPKILVIGVLALSFIYIATSAVFMYLVPAASVTNDEAFAALAGQALFGPAGGVAFAAAVAVSVIGTLFAYIIASPRVYFAMARDGLFFRSVGEPHPRFGTPHRATLIQVGLASLLIISGTFDQILSYFFFNVILFVALAVAGLFVFRGRGDYAGYRAPLFPLTPAVFLVMAAIVLFFVGMQNPVETLIGAVVVLAGIPVYHLVFKPR
jgi:APA family basic amino acid/polyamine antiporter